jgi:hypothetical protein
MERYAPKLRHFSLKLLLTRQVLIHGLRAPSDAARSALIDSEFLVVPLELPRKLLRTLLEMGLARLRANQGFSCLGKLLCL